MTGGFVVLHRKILDWEWYDHHATRMVFMHLLLIANWQDKKWHGKIIERGSVITSISSLSKRNGISTQQTRTSLNNLRSTNEITIKTTNNYTHITINNYESYQQINKPTTNEQQTNNKRITTTKQINNILNNTIPIVPSKAFVKKPFSAIDDLTDEVVGDIATQYSVSANSVNKELESLKLYCLSTGKRYKDYRATLQGWVRRKIDEGKIKQAKQSYKGEAATIMEQLERKYANNR